MPEDQTRASHTQAGGLRFYIPWARREGRTMTEHLGTPKLERPYSTTDGPAARFKLPSGTTLRLEDHPDSVLAGWSVANRLDETTASCLGDIAVDSSDVYVGSETAHRLAQPEERGKQLTTILSSAQDISLVRIERDHDAIVWYRHPADQAGELSVVADSWEHAADVADSLGAHDVAKVLPDLVKQLA